MVMNGLLSLSKSDIIALKEALRTGRLPPPYLPALIGKIAPRTMATEVSSDLQGMVASGANREGLVAALELLAGARASGSSLDEVVELVTTSPESGGATSRDTQVVVQDLFRSATRSVILAGYELYQAAPLFR